jgi:hypothetical protein
MMRQALLMVTGSLALATKSSFASTLRLIKAVYVISRNINGKIISKETSARILRVAA